MIDIPYDKFLVLAFLVLFNGLLAIFLKLDLGKKYLFNFLRAILQLALLATILQEIFQLNRPWAIMGIVFLMTIIAVWSSYKQIAHNRPGLLFNIFISMAFSAWSMAFIGLFTVRPAPWYNPQYFIPLAGMILGNSMYGITLGIERFLSETETGAENLKQMKGLRATAYEAYFPMVQRAMRASMTPILNNLAVMGIVSIPGMMTGQILAGRSPIASSKYQIMILALISSSIFLGSLIGIFLTFRQQAHREYSL